MKLDRTKLKSIYNDILKISVKDMVLGSCFLLLTSISLYSLFKLKNIESYFINIADTVEKEKAEKVTEDKEERGLTFLILKEEPKEYDFELYLTKHPKATERDIRLIKQGIELCKEIWPVDPLLYLITIEHESEFNPKAVSLVGAAGKAQFMPKTAYFIGKEKGWKVFLPDYFYKAIDAFSNALEYKSLSRNYFDNKRDDLAQYYRKLAENYQLEADSLFKKYKKELLELTKNKTPEELIKIHWPFNDSLAILEGVKYFAQKLKERKGDVREALSAYNAGLGSVLKANGIPFIPETINYQNVIVADFKYWSKKLEINIKKENAVTYYWLYWLWPYQQFSQELFLPSFQEQFISTSKFPSSSEH